MRVAGIDPGYERLGLAVVETSGKKPEVLYSACIRTPKNIPFPERLRIIGISVEQMIDIYQPSLLAVEELFFANNQKTAMRVAEARGAILYAGSTHTIPILEVTPNQIKVAICSDGRADKKQIDFMVRKIVSMTKEALDDEMDAVACALTGGALYHKNVTGMFP